MARSAATGWPRTRAVRLASVELFPVTAPALLAARPLADPADLAHHTLLHDENRGGWARWLHAAGAEAVAPDRGPLFAGTALAIHAAVRGHGVALGDRLLAAEDLAAGRLVRPFAQEVALGAYWLVTPEDGPQGEPARAFAAWLLDRFRAA